MFAGWRCCDDSYVSSVPESRIVAKEAYVLFYQRRKPDSSPATPLLAAPTINTDNVNEDEGIEGDNQTLVTELSPQFGPHTQPPGEGILGVATQPSMPLSLNIGSYTEVSSVEPATTMTMTVNVDEEEGTGDAPYTDMDTVDWASEQWIKSRYLDTHGILQKHIQVHSYFVWANYKYR